MTVLHIHMNPHALAGVNSVRGPLLAPSDTDLMRRTTERDSEAFSLLFDRYQAQVIEHLRQILRDPDVADDLTQEVFLRVWTRAVQWSGQGPFRAWLFRIAKNLAMNHLRSKGRRREQPLEIPTLHDDDDEERPVPGWMIDRASLGPDVEVERSEQRRMLQQLINDLPEEKREVFQMVHDGELALNEVAGRLEIPEGTVKSRLFHARKRLAEGWTKISGSS